MSLGYAEKLSYIDDVGKVGMSEIFDPPSVLQEKIGRLASMVKKSKHLVVFTGAGISTSSGIPDFRGPKGIWTLQKEGKAVPGASLPFHRAMPSISHMALVELERVGILKFLISQNIDGLHLRSGIPRRKLSELHGNSFMEVCPSCQVEYFRDFEVETIGLKETSRHCSNVNCQIKLRDTVLDWEDALPPKELDLAAKHCRMADLVLCLGTSLQITPACDLPLKCQRAGGKIVIINLQKTPKDKKASLVVHALVDKVISGVMDSLHLQIPPFARIDLMRTILTQPLSADKRYVNWTIRIVSVHGKKAPLPFIQSIQIYFPDEKNFKTALLSKQPFTLKRRTLINNPLVMVLKLNFSDSCACTCTAIRIPVNFMVMTDCTKFEKDVVFRELRDAAINDPSCGQSAVIHKNVTWDPKTETMDYAIVTNILWHKRPDNASETTLAASFSSGDMKRRTEVCDGIGTSRIRRKRPNHSLDYWYG